MVTQARGLEWTTVRVTAPVTKLGTVLHSLIV